MQIQVIPIRRYFGALTLLSLAFSTPARSDERDADYQRELDRATQLLSSGQAKDSIKVFEAANKLAGKKSAACFLGLSLAHLRLGEFKDAEKYADKAVEHSTTSHEHAEGLYYKGSALMGQDKGDGKKIAEGIPELRHALEIEPANAAYHYQLGVAQLRVREDDAGIELLERYLELVPNSLIADRVRGFIDYPLRAHPGYAPEFNLVTASGEEISLVNQRGRVLLLDFWATWCPPCVESVPWLKRLHEDLSGDPFTLLSVSVDEDEAAWTAFVEEKEMSWEQYRDDGKGITAEFLPKRFGIPTYIVIDGGGVIRGTFYGDDRRSLSRLKSTVEDWPRGASPTLTRLGNSRRTEYVEDAAASDRDFRCRCNAHRRYDETVSIASRISSTRRRRDWVMLGTSFPLSVRRHREG